MRHYRRYTRCLIMILFMLFPRLSYAVNEYALNEVRGQVRRLTYHYETMDHDTDYAFDVSDRLLYKRVSSSKYVSEFYAYSWKDNVVTWQSISGYFGGPKQYETIATFRVVEDGQGLKYHVLRDDGVQSDSYTEYRLDNKGRLIRKTSYNGSKKTEEQEFTYSGDSWNYSSLKTIYYENGKIEKQFKVLFSVLETDSMGNWTRRKEFYPGTKETHIATRTIQYYSDILTLPVSLLDFERTVVLTNEETEGVKDVVVKKDYVPVYYKPSAESHIVGYVHKNECFSAVNEEKGFYRIHTHLGHKKIKHGFDDNGWIRKSDVREFREPDYRKEIYYCKYYVKNSVNVRQAFKNGQLAGGDMTTLSRGEEVDVEEFLGNGKYALIRMWDTPGRRSGITPGFIRVGYLPTDALTLWTDDGNSVPNQTNNKRITNPNGGSVIEQFEESVSQFGEGILEAVGLGEVYKSSVIDIFNYLFFGILALTLILLFVLNGNHTGFMHFMSVLSIFGGGTSFLLYFLIRGTIDISWGELFMLAAIIMMYCLTTHLYLHKYVSRSRKPKNVVILSPLLIPIAFLLRYLHVEIQISTVLLGILGLCALQTIILLVWASVKKISVGRMLYYSLISTVSAITVSLLSLYFIVAALMVILAIIALKLFREGIRDIEFEDEEDEGYIISNQGNKYMLKDEGFWWRREGDKIIDD